MLQSARMSQVHEQEVVFMSCLSQAGWAKFLTRKMYSCHAPVRQDGSSSWPGSCIHVILESGKMNQALDQVVVFMSCSRQAGWIKFMTRKLHSCHAWVKQDEPSSWPGSCIHVMLQSGRMSQVHNQEVVFMSCLSQARWVKFITRKLYSCNVPVRQDESISWRGGCIIVMLEPGRMSQVHDHVVVFMSCSSQAGWFKFMNRKLYSCHAPVRQDESRSWPGSYIHVMLQSCRMNQVLDQEVVFMSCSSQAGRVMFIKRRLYNCHARVRQDESSSWPCSCIHVMLQSGRTSQLHEQEVVFMSCLAGWVRFISRKLYSCNVPVRQDESSSWREGCKIVILESGRMSQVHDHVVVFMSCSSHAGWVKFMNRRLYNCHAGVRQDESSSWPGSCIHGMLESGRMS
jgi:hypothetical protein